MIPLAERMRPKSLEDFVGQKQLSLLYEMINNDAVSSMIFWGPPGVGKTTLAKI
ncbi:MAG: replication-associated recombination protein A, partial [Erysipelotrichaceae bacterium]|nr:replication-associated recombination protein A [Erysipelotrichaceae bacterium]